MITREQWPRVKEIVGAALEHEESGRKAFLDSACLDNPQLRSEIDSLLAAYERSDDLFSGLAHISFEDAEVPQTIGPYQLKRELGRGGMGQVWLAEQMEPVHRYVALKLIRPDFYNPQIAQRFLAERQSLALMNHPAITQIFDAGTTLSGQPYLVMEYVDGLPITEYCDQKKISIAERLKLFQLVCEGVQHAHQKAIIHRDLKPSNILVTEVDGKPMPRIIDFGVAKALSSGFENEAFTTQIGSVIGTLGYMSPEQAEGEKDGIDTRSDVYSLGVVLYELLIGALPLDRGDLTYYGMLRQLREQDASRPSNKLRLLKNSATIAENRHTDVAVLLRQLRGDADSIALKALERDRNQRYATPSDLAADIDHYLRDEPVAAHSGSFRYFAGKYIRRHRVGVTLAAAGVLLMIGFVAAQSLQLRNTRRQRDRADRITEFMTSMFKVSDPSEARGSTITAREILDKSSHQIETGLAFDPTVQTQLMEVMAQTYVGLGLYDRADDLAKRALEERRRSFGQADPRTLESMTQMAEILDREGRAVEAEALMHTSIEQESRILGSDHELTLKSEDDLASLLGRHAHYKEAESLERDIIPVELRRLGPNHAQTFRSLNTLASSLRGQSRFAEGEQVFRQLLDSERRTLGTDHPYTLVTMHNLANMLAEEGRHEEAEAVYRETLAIEKRVLGPEHPDTVNTLTTLANTVRNGTGRETEAESLYREALAIQLRVVGPDHEYTTRAKEGLANELSSEHQYDEAQQLLQEVLVTRLRTLGPDNTDTLLTGYNLAAVLFRQNRFSEADKAIRKTLEGQIRVLDANDLDTLASEALLARILLKEKKPAEAETYAREAFEKQINLLGPQHEDTQDSLAYLADALVDLGRYGEAQTLYVSTIHKIAALPKGDLASAWYNYADMAAYAGRKDDAFEYLQHAIATGYTDADFMRTDQSMNALQKDPRYAQIMIAAQKQAAALPPKISH